MRMVGGSICQDKERISIQIDCTLASGVRGTTGSLSGSFLVVREASTWEEESRWREYEKIVYINGPVVKAEGNG